MKKYSLLLCALVSTVVFAGCHQSTNHNSTSMNLSTFGISTKQMTRDVTDPFTKQTQVKLKTQFGDSSARFSQIKYNSNNNMDVIELAQNNALTANKRHVLKKIDFNKISNFKKLSADQQKLAKQTNSIPYTVNSVGIIYNAKKVGKITSWDQLWNSKFKGKIAIPDITTTFGPAMLYIAGDHAKTAVEKDGGKAAFKSLKALKPNVVKTYTQSSDLANMFKNGEIDVAVVGDFATDMIQKSSNNMVYTVPASGTYANYDTISIVKNSKNLKNDYNYINYRLSETVQKKVASGDSLNNAPVNQQVTLSKADAKNKTYGDIAKRARSLDYNYINEHLSKWISTWNEIMNK